MTRGPRKGREKKRQALVELDLIHCMNRATFFPFVGVSGRLTLLTLHYPHHTLGSRNKHTTLNSTSSSPTGVSRA